MRNFLLSAACMLAVSAVAQQNKYTRYVNPMIGTAGTGHTFPGATVPFGLVQLSPETGFAGWDYCSGYRYEDQRIFGFSHTHLSGTGAKDLGDILLTPFTGNIKDSVVSHFSHHQEKASPGYYEVQLSDYAVKAQLTATAHVGVHRYTYPAGIKQGLVINLKSALVNKVEDLETHVLQSQLTQQDNHTLTGFTITQGWAGKQHVYFVIKLMHPITSRQWLSDSTANKNQIVALYFNGKTHPEQQVKVAISTVSISNAMENMKKEVADWNFEQIRSAAEAGWEAKLRLIQIEGSQNEKEIFYTAMYHAFIAPNNIADVNGQYRGVDNKVYEAPNKAYYSTLSLWDTYRALNPLFTILLPDKTRDIVSSMLAHEQVQGYLPVWTLWGHENHCMIGNHAIPVIAEAYIKGICREDLDKALSAVKRSSMVNHKGSDWTTYLKYGYFPADIIKREAVSKTLESGYDDYAVAQLAALANSKTDYDSFMYRSSFYKNVFDAATGFMRGKTASGKWHTPFDPFTISHAGTSGGDYTEGNAWQYNWHVQHDIPELIRLMGGADRFSRKLDTLFMLDSRIAGDGSTVDVTGLIGQYAHGNEPCHHVAYLYSFSGQPWKTADKIAEIIPKFYTNSPDGLIGNDDCGQMSAWYIFSALGLYPVNPVSATYVFGKPMYRKASIQVGNKTLVLKREDNGTGRYIQRVLLNGRPYMQNHIRHTDLISGGELTFVMGDNPVDYSKN